MILKNMLHVVKEAGTPFSLRGREVRGGLMGFLWYNEHQKQ